MQSYNIVVIFHILRTFTVEKNKKLLDILSLETNIQDLGNFYLL